MAEYIALLHKDGDSDFGVSFPDFPGCVTAGSTLEEARKLAAEALAFHIEGMIADGEAVPEPSVLDAVAGRPEAEDAIVFLVSVADPEPTYIRVNVTIPNIALREIDRFAGDWGISRSEFFTKSALAAVKGRLEEAARIHESAQRDKGGVRLRKKAITSGHKSRARDISHYGIEGWPRKKKSSNKAGAGASLVPMGNLDPSRVAATRGTRRRRKKRK